MFLVVIELPQSRKVVYVDIAILANSRKWMKSSEGWLVETSLLEIDGKELYPWKLIYPDGICGGLGQENATGVNLQVLKELPQLQEKERFGHSYMHMGSEKTCHRKKILITTKKLRDLQDLEITSRRDVVIVNEERRLLLLTLWNQYDQKEGRNLAEIGP
ncbi:hypothetical protein Tco_1431145 [Tanacetum coccineum]